MGNDLARKYRKTSESLDRGVYRILLLTGEANRRPQKVRKTVSARKLGPESITLLSALFVQAIRGVQGKEGLVLVLLRLSKDLVGKSLFNQTQV